jgi:hypothetical protein
VEALRVAGGWGSDIFRHSAHRCSILYSYVFIARWPIILGSRLDVIPPLQSLWITFNYINSQSIFSRTLLPWLPRTRSILVLLLSYSPTDSWFTTGLLIHRKYIRCPEMYICEPPRKHIFLCYCIYSALHTNKSYSIVACIFFVGYCSILYPATGCLPRICLRGNVFIEPLPSSGSISHNILLNLDDIRNARKENIGEKWKLVHFWFYYKPKKTSLRYTGASVLCNSNVFGYCGQSL